MTLSEETEGLPRFVVGIDLGTTNSAMAYVDAAVKDWRVCDMGIPQLVAPATVEARDTLPSFHYEAAAGEFSPGALRLPWTEAKEEPRTAVGFFARDHGAAIPGRLAMSAKSWLSHSGVDRTAGLLPWHGAPDVARLSPVEVSARYLGHLRAAWDHGRPESPLAQQDVVLTVPASFDEVARELTLEAARQAGLQRVTLLEEPQAAFYAWIHSHRDDWETRVQPGQTILVCDVGGGTSDFTLIRVRPAGEGRAGAEGASRGGVLFHRVAVGEHLILGGDNLDLALAHHVETRLGRLSPQQFGPLVRACRQVKETLLGTDPPEQLTLNVAGGGAKLIGGGRQVTLTRQEVQDLLVEGFLPRVEVGEKPASRRSGFQEFGLPYAPDAAITRYLAAFLTAHRPAEAPAARPDLVLFNGGLFESPVLRQRLLEVLASWFKPGPETLGNERLDLAVARGAAYYGMVRRGLGVRISGGLAHSYYIGVQGPDGKPAAVCLLPAGVEEGVTVDLAERTFELLIRQPVEFALYVSSTRTTDRPGTLLAVDPEQMTALPPIRTVLQSGRKSGEATVRVQLYARLNEIGTLEVWCAERTEEEKEGRGRKWKLQFDIRSATRSDFARHLGAGETQGMVDEGVIAACQEVLRAGFRASHDPLNPPGTLVRRLEQAAGMARHAWPASFMRHLWETLAELEGARRLSAEHESRWLNLTGYCLRPGYGLAVDDWRVAQTWRIYNHKVVHHRNEQCRAEWWILWRRLAGGLSAAQQQVLADPLLAAWRAYARRGGGNVKWSSPTFQFGPHESAETWRLLGALESLRPAVKVELGELLLEVLPKLETAGVREAGLVALGRLGARVPLYGPLNALTPAATAEQWARQVMAQFGEEERAIFALVQLTHRTGDRYRDVTEAFRQEVLAWLNARGEAEHARELVAQGGTLHAEEQRIAFGDALPPGLTLA